MNLLTTWLKAFHDQSRLKVKYKIIDKESYRETLENLNMSIRPICLPEFSVKNVSLGDMEQELKSHYVKLIIENAGYKQPHEYILYRVEALIENRYLLAFCSAYSNWPVGRLVILDEFNKVIRNDFKLVYDLSWKDYNEKEYQPKEKKVLAYRQTGKTSGKILFSVDLD